MALKKDQGTIFVGTPEVMRFASLKPLRRGIRLCRIFPHSVKPTTASMQILGESAAKNRIEVNEVQAKGLVNGSSIEIDAEVEDGFVLIVWQGFVLGVGFYKKPILKSHIPKFRPVE
ncbi:MAG: methyltransferase RsmF C-terminal domain-like protein [bacterium]